MRSFKKTTAVLLAFLFAFAPFFGGALNQISFAEDDFIESPILPIKPTDPDAELGIVYLFDDQTSTASVIDFTDIEAEYVVIPDTVEDGNKSYTVVTVATAAFSAASGLRAVVIPESVKTVEVYAFDACTKLADVWFEGDKAAFVQINIADGNEALINADIHYGACMKNAGPEDFSHTYDNHNDAECNACGKSRALVEDFTAGDLDDKEGVDIDDAIYLLFHVNFSSRYPVNQDVDFDKSGEVDVDDVFYLLYHVNFPDRYPIS